MIPNSTGNQMLVSVNSPEEFEIALRAGVPWIDFKNPLAGALGRPNIECLEEVSSRICDLKSEDRFQWSIAGGELLEWSLPDGFCEEDRSSLEILAGRGAIKWGLSHCAKVGDWKDRFGRLKDFLPKAEQAILAFYADHQRVDAPGWDEVFRAVQEFGLKRILIDTAVKDGKSLLDHLTVESLSEKIDQSHASGVQIAIAGSLRMKNLQQVVPLGADWIGFRGAVCRDITDRSSPIDAQLVQSVQAFLQKPN
jgi:uncharacterized protein (UPF0264 family)